MNFEPTREGKDMTIVETLQDELRTLEAVLSVRQDCTRTLAERPWTIVNSKLYELSAAIERICQDDVNRKRGELIRAVSAQH